MDCGLEDFGFESIWFALYSLAALAAETFAALFTCYQSGELSLRCDNL